LSTSVVSAKVLRYNNGGKSTSCDEIQNFVSFVVRLRVLEEYEKDEDHGMALVDGKYFEQCSAR